ncbi:MFS transporter [Pseudomonas sp. COR58]|uniref:MFS transporter n=1 Tax=Pseudomonas ekonensis TaxID=2842353 RepID=A0ABS6PER4_9PSED|nr:MFS transporter [Pseudomonas ekonensis]MBV4458968.1 MFS transporter [Pseudomonas ekonensis]
MSLQPLHRSPRWALTGLSLSMLMPSLDTSIANAGLPTLAAAFGAAFAQVQWVVLAYLLAITTLIVSAGRLGDLIGRRRLMLIGISLFTAASLCCALAPGLAWLITARAVQGLGAAVMLALTAALVGDAVPKAQSGRAMGLLGTMSAIGTSLGPSLGGLLIAQAGWPSIFLINVPLGLLNGWLVWRHLPADRAVETRVRFDHAGTMALALTLGAYALAMTVTGTPGATLALLSISLLGLGLFVAVERRAAAPLMRMALFADPRRAAGLAMTALVATVMMTTLVVGPFYLSRGLGLGSLAVGLALSVGPLVAALGGVPAGWLVDRFGARRMVAGGLSAMAGGCLLLAVLPTGLGLPGYLVPIAWVTAGYALFQAANSSALMVDVGQDLRGVMSAMLGLARNLGLITGAAAMGTVFALAAGDPAQAPAAMIAAGLHLTFGVAATLMAIALAVNGRARSLSVSVGLR